MTKYIDRKAALENWPLCDEPGDAYQYIRSYPAADVVPVVLASWQSWEQDKPPCKWYSCDYCGFHALSKSNYCPNCGADMREGKHEN